MICESCERDLPALTRHHLIPKKRHRNRRIRRMFDKGRLHEVAFVCRPCHDHIHKLFSEKELASEFNTMGKLREEPQMQTFISFIRKQPATFKPKRRIRRRNGF